MPKPNLGLTQNSKVLTLRCPIVMYEQLRALALKEDRPLNNYTVRVLRRHVMDKGCYLYSFLWLISFGPISAAEVYDKDASKRFELHPPLILKEANGWKDGGSIGITLLDFKGKELSFCLNRAIASKESRDHIYLGATYWRENGTRDIDPSSETEKALLILLKNWLDANWTKTDQQKFRRRLENPRADPNIKQEEINAMLVLDIIEVLEKR